MNPETISAADLDLVIQSQALWIDQALTSLYVAQSGISRDSLRSFDPGTVCLGPAARRLPGNVVPLDFRGERS